MTESKSKIKYIMQLPVLWLGAFFILAVGSMPGIIVDYMLPESVKEIPFIATCSLYFAFLGIWVFAIPYFKKSKKNSPVLNAIGTKPAGNNWKFLLLGFLIGGGLNLICAIVAMINKDIAVSFDSFKPITLILILICVFIQSSAEELLCRGYLYQRLIKAFKHPLVAIIGNSIFFGLIHSLNDGVTVLSVVNNFLAGILYSLMVYYLDSIWCAMAAHTAWNFMQNIILGLPNSGNVVPISIFKLDLATARDSWAYNIGFGIEGTILCSVLVILASIALYLWGRKHAKKPIDIWA